MMYRITIKSQEDLMESRSMNVCSIRETAGRVFENFQLITRGEYIGGYRGFLENGDGVIFLESEIETVEAM